MNSWQFAPFAWFYIFAVGISFWIAFLAWRMRPVRGAKLFSLLAIFSGIWALGYLLGFFNASPTWKLVMLRVEYIGIIGSPWAWLLFTAAYTQRSKWLSKHAIITLSILPVISFLLVLTINSHQLFYTDYEIVQRNNFWVFEKQYGIAFYILIAYAYILVLTGGAILIQGMINMPGKYRWQSVPLVFVTLIILSPNLIYLTKINPIHPYDPTSIAFIVAGVIIYFTMRWYRFLDISPVAHYLVFKHVTSGVIVLDHHKRILDLNPAAERILNRSQEHLLGKPILDYLPADIKLPAHLQKSDGSKLEISIDDKRCYELQSTKFQSRIGESENSILMFYDISTRFKSEKELRHLATIDSLTGVNNRRYFFELVDPIYKHALRYKRQIATLMVDLDHFKNINDQHGHLVGDQVLYNVAQKLQNQIRSPDILARYGGEEFIIVMPETNVESAHLAAERIRQNFDHEPDLANASGIPVTISIGVAILDFENDTTIEKLIDRADYALYHAKQSGRNRVVLYNDLAREDNFPGYTAPNS